MRKAVVCHMRITKTPSHSLISVFVVRCSDGIMPIDVVTKIPRHWLARVAEQAGLSFTWSQTSEDRFSRDVPHTYPSSA